MIYDLRGGFLDLKALSLKDELEREDINKLIEYMIPHLINATDRNTINHDDYQCYFKKLLTLNNNYIQNDVLTKEMVQAKGLKQLSNIGGIIGWGLVITSYIYPDSIIKTVEAMAMSASNMLNRANTLVNVGYGEDLIWEKIILMVIHGQSPICKVTILMVKHGQSPICKVIILIQKVILPI